MSTLSVIVPATNHPATLPQCLAAIQDAASPPEQLLVVEDASLTHPALARNSGAAKAAGDILVFIDADVTVHRDVFEKFRAAFAADQNLVAIFGSYDDAPASPGIVSEFRNLLHHHVHQEGAGPAGTFWAGLGAMRRSAFEAAGGYSVHPIEDIELGMRLVDGGARIVLDPTIQGTHLKHWSLLGMVRTDLFVRGIPWVGLLMDRRGSASLSGLNLGWRHRISALASVALLLGLLLRNVWLLGGALAVMVVFNLRFYRLLWRRQGPWRTCLGVGLHAIHHLVSVLAVPLGLLAHLRAGRRAVARVAAA
ncbi:MAG: glycosyltransferase family A protein [Gemmatimonadota bacterium]